MSPSRTPMSASAPGLAGKVVMAVALLTSASAAAYFAYDARAARAARTTPETRPTGDDERPVTSSATGTAPSAGDLARLELENRELKRRLAQMMVQAETGQPAAAAERPRGRGRWLEGLKEKDPERYKKMVERREERRLSREVALQDQISRVEERLEAQRAASEGQNGQESPQAQKQGELLNQIASTLQELGGLRDKWSEINQLPDAERFDKAQELFQKSQELRGKLADLQQQDRDNQLKDLGSRLGLGDGQVEDLSRSVNQIVKDTSPPRPGGPRGGAAGAGPAGGGGRR